VRTERHKYIHYFTQPEEFELYDLDTDPQEMNNLYGKAVHAQLVKRLSARLEELRRETGDHYVYQPTVLLKEQVASSECADRLPTGKKDE
jgi:arylsulfatase A-like enzyme